MSRHRRRTPEDVHYGLKELAYRQPPPSVRWLFSEWEDVSRLAFDLLEEWEMGRDTRHFSRKLQRQVDRLEILHQMIEPETVRLLRLARSLPLKTRWNVGSPPQPG